MGAQKGDRRDRDVLAREDIAPCIMRFLVDGGLDSAFESEVAG
jgi:hypothetical protein